MSYPAYPEYKDSGVEWLGEVPAHWDVTTGKRLFSNRKERALQGDNQLSATQKYGVVPQNLFMESEQQKVTLALSGISSFRHVEVGDFVISLRSFQGGIEISDHSGCVSPAYTVMKPANKVDGSYFKHLLKSYGFISILNVVSDGIRDGKTISYDQFSSVAFPVPPKEEQLLVATFLDHETARIDALVEEQQRLIALLKEKRQAVISHAVIKGLDPDVPMKDSGVEWLGEVPEHWEVKKLKHFGKVIGGYAFKSTDFSEAGHPVIKISNVGHLEFDWEDSSFLDDDFYYSHKDFTAPKNSLIFAMTRPIIAGGIKVAKLSMDNNPLINQRVGFMTIKEEGLANFIVLATQSDSFIAQFKNNLTVTNQPNISSEGIESVSVAIPPKQELKTIIQSLEKAMEKFLQLIFFATKNIELLQERRSALISAAVTGKIDVRGWQPPEGADAKEVSQQEVV